MPDCTYCEESFADDESYLDHLEEAHYGELSRIDRRRVDSLAGGGDRSRLVLYAAVGVVVLLLAAAVYVTTLSGDSGSTPLEAQTLPDNGDDALLSGVQRYPSEGAAHVEPGTQIDYDTSPPTSGPHYPRPAEAGFYEEAPPAGNVVHSLEHGAVVIYYEPDTLSSSEEESLRAFVDAHQDPWASVLVVPNPNESPESRFVLTAWRTTLRMDDYDPEVVRAFLAEFIGRGPENPVR